MIRTNKGFTLIELMVVIVIIGVLAAIAIPKFTDASVKAKISEVPTVLASFEHAQFAYFAEAGMYADNMSSLDFSVPASKYFVYPAVDAIGGGAGVAAVYSGTNMAGKQLGPIAAGTMIGTTTMPATGGTPVHTTAIAAGIQQKYLASFLPTP
jgi:prepilin-type N-terminal cleavage/methylation domain-containing protein